MRGGVSLYQVQVALFGILTADVTGPQSLQGLLGGTGRIFDQVPSDQDFPYITFGNQIEQFSDTLGESVKELNVDLCAWSRYQGNAQAATILDRMAYLFDRQDLTITGWDHGGTTQQRAVVLNPDNITRQGILTLSLLVSKQ